MTINQFFALLRQHRGSFIWDVENGNVYARHPNIDFRLDPLGVVAAAELKLARKTTQPMLAAEELGLSHQDAHQIMLAGSIKRHELRKQLIEACGLEGK